MWKISNKMTPDFGDFTLGDSNLNESISIIFAI